MSLENQVIYNIMIYHKHGLQSIVRDCLIRSPPSLLFPAPVQVRFRAFRLQTGSLAPDYARTADFCQRDFRYAAVRADSSVADGPTPDMCVVAASLPILGGFIPSLSVIKKLQAQQSDLECWNRGKKSREQARSGALVVSGVCVLRVPIPRQNLETILIEKIRKSVSDCVLLRSLTSKQVTRRLTVRNYLDFHSIAP